MNLEKEKKKLVWFVVDGPYTYPSAKFIQKRYRERLGLKAVIIRQGEE